MTNAPMRLRLPLGVEVLLLIRIFFKGRFPLRLITPKGGHSVKFNTEMLYPEVQPLTLLYTISDR